MEQLFVVASPTFRQKGSISGPNAQCRNVTLQKLSCPVYNKPIKGRCAADVCLNVTCFWVPTHRILSGLKVKVKVKFTLQQATKAQRGSRGIFLLFL